MYKVSQEQIERVWGMAFFEGWEFLTFQKDIYMISFVKEDKRVNLYMTTRTVATTLYHPKRKDRNQLYRKKVTDNELLKIFKNPRVHTGKGYRRK